MYQILEYGCDNHHLHQQCSLLYRQHHLPLFLSASPSVFSINHLATTCNATLLSSITRNFLIFIGCTLLLAGSGWPWKWLAVAVASRHHHRHHPLLLSPARSTAPSSSLDALCLLLLWCYAILVAASLPHSSAAVKQPFHVIGSPLLPRLTTWIFFISTACLLCTASSFFSSGSGEFRLHRGGSPPVESSFFI